MTQVPVADQPDTDIAGEGDDGSHRAWPGEPADHAIGRSRGGLSTKIHAAVDGRGRPLALVVTAGQAGDSPVSRALLRRRGITAVIPEPRDQQAHRARRGSAGGRPVTYNTDLYKRRNTVERAFNRMKHWRELTTRYDELALVYCGGVALAAVLTWLEP